MGCGQPASAGPLGPARLLSLAADAVRAAAGQAPVVVVVEDLHWADASTCDLVSYLVRVLRRDPVLLLVTVRAEELDPARPVAESVSELTRAPQPSGSCCTRWIATRSPPSCRGSRGSRRRPRWWTRW